ncbi:MAG TPA: AbrB/MazE/SpoVT family DNA-binding domain-containing protein [Patescibacteria group bacterium]|nr:AbrB/MazE/SpoVT family DNA-binding domain-containing protein [Patescibacteria group bacterium]
MGCLLSGDKVGWGVEFWDFAILYSLTKVKQFDKSKAYHSVRYTVIIRKLQVMDSMYTVKLSSKNQITLPAALVRQLKIPKGGRLILELQKHDAVTLRPQKKSLVEELGGCLTKYVPPEKLNIPFDQVMEETKRLAAKEIAKRL